MCHFTSHLQRQEAATQASQLWSLTHYGRRRIYFGVSLFSESDFEADRWTDGGGGGGGKFHMIENLHAACKSGKLLSHLAVFLQKKKKLRLRNVHPESARSRGGANFPDTDAIIEQQNDSESLSTPTLMLWREDVILQQHLI